MLISCAQAPLVVTEHEVVEVPVEVTVKVNAELVKKGELAVPDKEELEQMSGKDRLIHVTALYHWNTIRAMQCYSQLDAIAELE